MTRSVDVAIVGLGPVGAVLAASLGRAGVDTLAIDRLEDLYPLPRAIGLDHDIMRTMQNLGLAGAIEPHVTRYRPTEYRGADDQIIARFDSLPPPWPQGWRPSYMFDQPPFERAIRKALAAMPSVDVRLSTTLVSFEDRGDAVDLKISTDGRAEETVSARYLIGCDGGSSLVRKSIGVAFDSLDFDEPWLVIDALVNEDKLAALPDRNVQYCDPRRPATYVIGPGNHRRWEIMLLPGEDPEDMCRDETVWRLLDRWLQPQDGKLWRAATYVFHALVAREWRRGRVLLAGDAAHMTPPFMAQGMCQGIRDAADLAWKLPLVLRGQVDPVLLDTYGAERRPHVCATTETAKALGRIICELDPEQARARDRRLLAERGDPPDVQIRQDLIPALDAGAILFEQGAPAGARFPQPRVATPEGEALLDDLTGARFRIVFAADAEVPEPSARMMQLIGALDGVVVRMVESGVTHRLDATTFEARETEGVLKDWFARNQAIAALVRPDHYLFGVARDTAEFDRLAEVARRRLELVAHG
jgi:3-(3-hydroxy-phenyl)propionate hydroxylase